MAFAQVGISDVRVLDDGPDLYVSWSSATPGATYQVYIDRHLSWWGRARRCQVPRPAGPPGRNIWVHVGTVDPREATADFSALIPATVGLASRARLAWKGGTYLDPSGRDDIQGFRIYASSAPDAPIDATRPVATVAAYSGGWIGDGFGMGGFGEGGFGRAATDYRWESEPLTSGVWRFAVVPFDTAGNARGAGQGVSVTIAEAPRPPAMLPDGSRLAASYSGPSTRSLTITWLPSNTSG